MLVVGDDCALPYSHLVGRRGIAGTVFVHKVLFDSYQYLHSLVVELSGSFLEGARHVHMRGCNGAGKLHMPPALSPIYKLVRESC